MIRAVHPRFPSQAFLRTALAGYESLELMARGAHIAEAMREHLPGHYPTAAGILVRSLGPPLKATEGNGMAPFLYLPHVLFVARHGLEHFEESMRAQHELTRRFSAEFSIRAYLERHPEATLARLRQWAADPDPHVRRLVSEGTRPRLPWARRLRDFQRDPRPVLELLEALKDDPEPYVRRSVANNLNDIGKDNPAILIETARRWLRGADANRRWLVAHALRSAVKRGEAGALSALGYPGAVRLALRSATIAPAAARIGAHVVVRFTLANRTRARQRAVVDFRVHFVKARGEPRPKVFKMRAVDLAPGESAVLAKKISLAQRTTRRHHPGVHRVEALVNGRARPLGSFRLEAQAG